MPIFVAIMLVLVMVVWRVLTGPRGQRQLYGPGRQCHACQLNHPPFANYCRQCGRRLP
jgi:hypothetical protein